MEFNVAYENKRPGLIYILCDLSEKMQIVESQLQDAVKSIITSYINGCVTGTLIKNHIFITLIGYGNGSPHILQQGWAKDWEDTLVDVHINNAKLIKEPLLSVQECESVWKFVGKEIFEAFEFFKNNTDYFGLASPHIINITNRKPSNEELCANYINEIKLLNDDYANKNPGKFFGILISSIILLDKYSNFSDVLFLRRDKSYNSKKIEFWKNIVSEVDSSFVDFIEASEPVDFEYGSHSLCCCIHDSSKCNSYALWTYYD